MLKNKKRRSSVKTVRAFKELNNNFGMVQQKAPKCPYCGNTMQYREASVTNSKYAQKGDMVYICPSHGCDCYCRTRKDTKGNILLVSTPANQELRMMRKEAHFYLDQVLKNGIFTNYGDAYCYLTGRIPYAKDKAHIGEMNNGVCAQFINEIIVLLYNNKHKLSSFEKWAQDKVLTDENRGRVKELLSLVNAKQN